MSYNNFIDSVAAFSKLGIELSGQAPDNKKLAETKVDCISSLLKLAQPLQSKRPTQIEIDFEWVRQIKKIAQKYSVDRVVLFLYPVENQNFISLLHVYGGETTKFLGEIGFYLLDNNSITAEENTNLTQWERECGIILYERDLDI